MSASMWFSRPGEDTSKEVTWDCSSAMLVWLMSFLAERVDDPVAAARLAQVAEWGVQWLPMTDYTDDGVRAIVRVLRDDLPAAVDAEWPPPDPTNDHLRDLVAMATRWAGTKGLL